MVGADTVWLIAGRFEKGIRVEDAASRKDPQKGLTEAWASLSGSNGEAGGGPAAAPIGEVGTGEATPRISTGISELDRVLGGEVSRTGFGSEQPKSGSLARGLVPVSLEAVPRGNYPTK